MDCQIRAQAPADAEAIARLIEESFGPARKTRTVYRFRENTPPLQALGFVAADGDAVVGSVRFWPVQVAGQRLPLLGPLAVRMELRGCGIGHALIAHGIAAVRESGHAALLIVGDPGYYADFGFSVEPVANLRLPGPVGPLAFMGLEFNPGALSRLTGPVLPDTPDS